MIHSGTSKHIKCYNMICHNNIFCNMIMTLWSLFLSIHCLGNDRCQDLRVTESLRYSPVWQTRSAFDVGRPKRKAVGGWTWSGWMLNIYIYIYTYGYIIIYIYTDMDIYIYIYTFIYCPFKVL